MTTMGEPVPSGAGGAGEASRGPVRGENTEHLRKGVWAKPVGGPGSRKLHFFPDGEGALCGRDGTAGEEAPSGGKWGRCTACKPATLSVVGGRTGWWAAPSTLARHHFFWEGGTHSRCGRYDHLSEPVASEEGHKKCKECEFSTDQARCPWCLCSFQGEPGDFCSDKCEGHFEDVQKLQKALTRYANPNKLLSPEATETKRSLEAQLAYFRKMGRPTPPRKCERCKGPYIDSDDRRTFCFGCKPGPLKECECLVCGRVMIEYTYDDPTPMCPLSIHTYTPVREAIQLYEDHKTRLKEIL